MALDKGPVTAICWTTLAHITPARQSICETRHVTTPLGIEAGIGIAAVPAMCRRTGIRCAQLALTDPQVTRSVGTPQRTYAILRRWN